MTLFNWPQAVTGFTIAIVLRAAGVRLYEEPVKWLGLALALAIMVAWRVVLASEDRQ